MSDENKQSDGGGLLDRLPKTKDGRPIFLGDTVFSENHDRSFFGDHDQLEHTVLGLSSGLAFDEYEGSVTVSAEGWEGGNLDCYHSRGNVPQHQNTMPNENETNTQRERIANDALLSSLKDEIKTAERQRDQIASFLKRNGQYRKDYQSYVNFVDDLIVRLNSYLPIPTADEAQEPSCCVPVELFEEMCEWGLELRALWDWKKEDAGPSNQRDYDELNAKVERAIELMRPETNKLKYENLTTEL